MGLEKYILKLKEIKNLNSEIRLEMLEKLNKRRATVSELSRSLSLSKSTVLYHLYKLGEIDLVKRVNNSQGNWIYYELTEKGKGIIQFAD